MEINITSFVKNEDPFDYSASRAERALMQSLKDTLISARALITDFNHWITNYSAMTKEHIEIDPRAQDAYAFCADGALCRVANGLPQYIKAFNFLNKIAQELFEISSLIELNDWGPMSIRNTNLPDDEYLHLCHKSILDLFDEAIKHCAKTHT